MSDSSKDSPLKMFLSEPFCILLSHLTGLQLSHRLLEPDPEHENESCGSSSANVLGQGNEGVGCHGNIYHWRPGRYTLMSDTSSCQDQFLLEAILHFNADSEEYRISIHRCKRFFVFFFCLEWTAEMGGEAHYILKGEDEEVSLSFENRKYL